MKATLKETNNFNVTEFSELKFNPHPAGLGGIQAYVRFRNGYGASIVQSQYSYGGSEGLYELAVFGQDGHITYDTPITDDVLGFLTEDRVTEILKEIKNL